MGIIKYRPEALAADLDPAAPVATPLGEPVSQVASKALASATSPTTRTGVWTCSPGRWVRQVTSARVLLPLWTAECIFEPEQGEPIHISAGDVVYFPANSRGVWNVIAAATKTFRGVFEQ